jgi:hypothetical protein
MGVLRSRPDSDEENIIVRKPPPSKRQDVKGTPERACDAMLRRLS